jgi:hypothetical protein
MRKREKRRGFFETFVYLLRRVHQRVPRDLGHEPPDEIRIKLGFPLHRLLHVAKREREVVRRAGLGVACEQVVRDQSDHGGVCV